MAYTVKSGDRIQDIAAALLGDWSRWPELLEANPGAFSIPGNVRSLQIGATINLPGEETTDPGATTDPDDGSGRVDPDAPITDSPPVSINDTTIPDGARVVVVRNPEGSDAAKLWYLVYDWRGVEMAYEVGDDDRFVELFGPARDFTKFDTIQSVSQTVFDSSGFVLAGAVDSIVGSTESLGSQIEREVRALGLEDMPSWMAESSEVLHLVATGAAGEWSTGRLWTELATTTAFQGRFGAVLESYQQGGESIGSAVNRIVADEGAFREALTPFGIDAGVTFSNEYIHTLINKGWTASSASAVMDAAEVLRTDESALDTANAVLEFAGLGTLDPVSFINAIKGFGDREVIEALNTAAAGVALEDAGLGDVDLDLLAEVVDTSSRLLTSDDFSALAQELAFNTIRFGAELDFGSFGITRDDLVAAAFGETNPEGKTPGEVLNLLGRFERDRRGAAGGFDAATGFQNEEGRLVIQGLAGL